MLKRRDDLIRGRRELEAVQFNVLLQTRKEADALARNAIKVTECFCYANRKHCVLGGRYWANNYFVLVLHAGSCVQVLMFLSYWDRKGFFALFGVLFWTIALADPVIVSLLIAWLFLTSICALFAYFCVLNALKACMDVLLYWKVVWRLVFVVSGGIVAFEIMVLAGNSDLGWRDTVSGQVFDYFYSRWLDLVVL